MDKELIYHRLHNLNCAINDLMNELKNEKINDDISTKILNDMKEKYNFLEYYIVDNMN